ncbi:MAG: hypothetical protein ACLVKK_01435 [Ruthenibacterium sp.]
MPKRALLSCTLLAACAALLCACSSQGAGSAPQSGAPKAESQEAAPPFAEIHTCTAYGEDGFYTLKAVFPNSLNLTYIDYTARQELFLCNRPECLHNDDTCKSYIQFDSSTGVQPSLYLAGDTVLLIYSGAGEASLPRIEAMELDGSSRHIVAEFKASQTLVPPYLFDAEFLYFSLITQHEQPLSQTNEFIRVSLKDGSAESIYTFSQNINSLIAGTYENSLVADMVYDQNDKTYRKFFTWQPGEDFEQASETNMIYEYCLAEQGAMVENGYLYILDFGTKAVTRKSLATGEENTVDCSTLMPDFEKDMEPRMDFTFEDYVLINTYRPHEQYGFVVEQFLADFRNGELTPIHLENLYQHRPIYIVSEYEDELCVICDYNTHTDTFEQDGQTYTSEYVTEQYAMLKKSDYIASRPSYQLISSLGE